MVAWTGMLVMVNESSGQGRDILEAQTSRLAEA